MNVIIIEDEPEAALDLAATLRQLRPDCHVLSILDSVEAGVAYFARHPSPDLILADIQLGDGLSFDILREADIACPVVFCTAYDAYAIRAFGHNGIDYLLKPVDREALQKSLRKIDLFRGPASHPYDPAQLYRMLREMQEQAGRYKKTFLVSYREKMIPVGIDQVACFGIRADGGVVLHTVAGKPYAVTYTLDYLETVLPPAEFYRANRQYLVACHAVREVEQYFDRKLLIKLTVPGLEPVVVSKAKAADFLRWLENR